MQDKLDQSIRQFWDWFRDVGANLTNAENPDFLKEIDDRITALNPELSWEVGPGFSEPWRFVVSPNLNHELRELAREIIAYAPVLSGWEFYSTRQSKDWDYKFTFENNQGDSIPLDASGWTFVLLRYPDVTHEVLLCGRNLPNLEEDERWQAAAIVLESVLGEDLIMDKIDRFELVRQLESRFANADRPIQQLRDAMMGSSS